MIRCVVTLKSALIIASWTLIQRNMIQVAGSRYVASVSNLKYPDTDMCVRIRRTWYTYVCHDMMYQIQQAGAHYDISDTEKRCIRYRVKTCIKLITDVAWVGLQINASDWWRGHSHSCLRRKGFRRMWKKWVDLYCHLSQWQKFWAMSGHSGRCIGYRTWVWWITTTRCIVLLSPSLLVLCLEPLSR